MITLNESSAFLWKFFNADHTVDEAVAALLGEYDVDEATAKADVEKFADTLLKNGFAE